VWLPPADPRAVLLLNDGQNVFAERSRRPTWRAEEVARTLIERKEIVPLAIVGIDSARGASRFAEYLPYPDPHNPRARRFAADAYANAVVGWILPALRRLHPALAHARQVAIGGSSYGAIAALHTAARHPGTFGRLLIESAPLWVGDGRLIDDARRALRGTRAWIAVGTAESRSLARDRELSSLARRLAAAIAGRTPGRVAVTIVSGAPHHESAWAARFGDALRWLFPR
jgi:predicted alpha/beta superfamily hydrolase